METDTLEVQLRGAYTKRIEGHTALSVLEKRIHDVHQLYNHELYEAAVPEPVPNKQNVVEADFWMRTHGKVPE